MKLIDTVSVWILLSCIVLEPLPALGDDNLLAHRLFEQGNYARAAEIFTDPAWKGVALYRSEQWWRAAEAFVRANDVQSMFNLGNSYARLGYYKLALQAYQGVLQQDVEHEHAQHNADLMLALISADEKDKQGQSLMQPKELERIAAEQSSEDGAASGGEKDKNQGESAANEDSPGEETANRDADQMQQGASGDDADAGPQNAENDSVPDLAGETQDHQETAQASGSSATNSDASRSQAAGMRSQLEAAQATQQWLNQIEHDGYRFLQKQIELETDRRAAANQAAPKGGSVW